GVAAGQGFAGLAALIVFGCASLSLASRSRWVFVSSPVCRTVPKRLLMWGYSPQVPEGALASVLVDDQERQQSSSVPFGKVHPEVRAGFESRLADLLPSLLFELVQQCGNSSIQAVYSVAARSYARDRVCLVGDAGAVFPPFTASGVLRA